MTANSPSNELRCRTWRAEGLLRMLENVLAVGENPEELIVYASLGKAARDWPSYHAIVAALTTMAEDQTLILQSGRPIGVLNTHRDAPMVISAINNTVGQWSDPERFYQRMSAGQTIWGGLTAGAWQYIGRQGVLLGTYELFREICRSHHLDGWSWVLTAGLGGMGSAQPISAAMIGLSSVTVEVNPAKVHRLHKLGILTHVLDTTTSTLDSTLTELNKLLTWARANGKVLAVGIIGHAAGVFTRIARRAAAGSLPNPDLVTDQTAAHDLRYGYLPDEVAFADWVTARETDPTNLENQARKSIAAQVQAMLQMCAQGSVGFENGNNLRVQARSELTAEGQLDAICGFMKYLRPLFCRGIGPFRWVILSGREVELDIIDDLAARLLPERPEVAESIRLAREFVPTQGLPARSCWLGFGERTALAQAVNKLVSDGTLSAPVLFSRDHLDSAAMTHPMIGTEAMLDGSDGVADWPLLDAMLMAAGGGDLVAVHSGGGGYSGWMQSAGISIIADGSAAATARLRVLDLDSGLGVLRHAEAGYREAKQEINKHVETSIGQLNWLDVAAKGQDHA